MNDQTATDAACEPTVEPKLLPVLSTNLLRVSQDAHASLALLDGNPILSTEARCTMSGVIMCNAVAVNTMQVMITLENLSDPRQPGYLTAFMFRLPRELGQLQVSLVYSSRPGMSEIRAGASGAPFLGQWHGGAGTGGEWQAGGTPTAGIAPGATGEWVFLVSGPRATELTAEEVMSGGRIPDPFAFIVRFRGIGSGHSDKVPVLMPPSQIARMAAVEQEVESRR
jgi:hypothetical protein